MSKNNEAEKNKWKRITELKVEYAGLVDTCVQKFKDLENALRSGGVSVSCRTPPFDWSKSEVEKGLLHFSRLAFSAKTGDWRITLVSATVSCDENEVADWETEKWVNFEVATDLSLNRLFPLCKYLDQLAANAIDAIAESAKTARLHFEEAGI